MMKQVKADSKVKKRFNNGKNAARCSSGKERGFFSVTLAAVI